MNRRRSMMDAMSKELSGADLLAEVATPEPEKKPQAKVEEQKPKEVKAAPQKVETAKTPKKGKKRGPPPDPEKAQLVTTTIRLRADQHNLLRVAAIQVANPGVKADVSDLLRQIIDQITAGARSDQTKSTKLVDFVREDA